MGHDDVASGYSISTGFCRLTGCQRNPRDRGVTVDVLNQFVCIIKWTLGRGKLLSHVGCENNRVTIVALVRIRIKFSEICDVTQFFFFFLLGKAICMLCL